MRLPRVRFTIGRFMILVVAAALILAAAVAFLRSPPGERRALLVLVPTAGLLLALVWAPLVVAGVRGSRQPGRFGRRDRRTPPQDRGIRFLDET
jgi:hypothetical protein